MHSSEEVGLLHDPDELLLVDLPVPVAVGLVDHLLQLLVSHRLAQLAGNALQVLEGDLARAVVVEQPEGLQDLLPRVALRDLASHQLHEVRELDHALSLPVHLRNHLLHLLLLGLEPQRTHRHLELLGVDVS
jgi:hypothetical protein